MATYLDGDIYLGAFLPGLKKFVKKVGKVTSPITTAIAKSVLPSGLVDLAAKVDPSRTRPSAPQGIPVISTPPTETRGGLTSLAGTLPGGNTPLLIAGGGLLLVVLVLALKK